MLLVGGEADPLSEGARGRMRKERTMEEEVYPTEEQSPQFRQGNFFSRLIWTFVSPSRLYDDIHVKPAFWEPWVVVALLSILAAFLSMPIQQYVMETGIVSVPQEAVEGYEKTKWISLFFAPLGGLLGLLIYSLIGYVVVAIVSEKGSYSRYLCLFSYSYLVILMSGLVSVIMVRARGLDAITSMSDMQVSFDLSFLVPELHNKALQKGLQALASSLGIFQIWFFILIALGVRRLFGLSRAQSWGAVVPLWFVGFALALMRLKFSKMG